MKLPNDNQRKALAAVQRAKYKGLLPKLDGAILCVDCGRSAIHYDHRDYLKPLDVVPTCQSCNFKRGRAKHWKKEDMTTHRLTIACSKTTLKALKTIAQKHHYSMQKLLEPVIEALVTQPTTRGGDFHADRTLRTVLGGLRQRQRAGLCHGVPQRRTRSRAAVDVTERN